MPFTALWVPNHAKILENPNGFLGSRNGIIFSIFVIQGVFGIKFVKALIVWLFYVIAQFVAVLLVGFVFGGALIYSIS